MTKRFLATVVVCVLALAGAACGGGGDDDDSADAGDNTPSASGGDATTTTAGADLPQFSSDFSRLCTTQVGFKGAAAYEAAAGVHPMMFFEKADKNFVSSSRDFPDGWVVKEDMDFEDNSELKNVQLIACADRIKETPTGKKCELDDDGKKVTLELVNATYEVKVYKAIDGESVHTATIETKETDCPFIAVYEEGETTYVATPDDDEYINAVKPAIAPG